MQNIPEGWKLVPVEPTEEMRAAYYGCIPTHHRHPANDKWHAMLSAAPTPPQPQEHPRTKDYAEMLADYRRVILDSDQEQPKDVEPTDEMVEAAQLGDKAGPKAGFAITLKRLRAAIAAAPTPPQPQEQAGKDAAIELWNNCGGQLQKADDVLRSISSYLGQGGMWDVENLDYEEVEKRIKEGIDFIQTVERKRAQEPVGVIKEDGPHWDDAFVQSVSSDTLLFTFPPDAQQAFQLGVKMAAENVAFAASQTDDWDVRQHLHRKAMDILALAPPADDMVVMSRSELENALRNAFDAGYLRTGDERDIETIDSIVSQHMPNGE